MNTQYDVQDEDIALLGDKLRQRKWQISCAESCTGGGLAFYFTRIAGSSDWFSQSWVTYSNAAKHQQLGVSEHTLATQGAVSEQTVTEMAAGVRHHSGAHVAVAISGVAGPGGGSAEKPVGTVWFGFCINEESEAIHMQFDGDRDAVRQQAIGFAIAHLNNRLF